MLQEVMNLNDDTSISSICFHPNRSLLASGSNTVVSVWELSSARLAYALVDKRTGDISATSVAYSPDGAVLASGTGDNLIFLWDASTGAEILSSVIHDDSITALVYSPDRTTLITASIDGVIKLWSQDIRGSEFRESTTQPNRPSNSSLQLLRIITNPEGSVFSLSVSPDSKIFASGSQASPSDNNAAGTLKLWNVPTGEEIGTLSRGAPVYSVVFSPSGQVLASAHNDSFVKLWDVASSNEIGTLQSVSGRILAFAVSQDGRLIAGGTDEGGVVLWNLRTGESVDFSDSHRGNIYTVQFSPDGKLLASAGEEGIIRLWVVE